MGKKGGRHAAKTGDKALYRKRMQAEAAAKHRKVDEDDVNDDREDNMYNQVERFHNQREAQEYLKFDDAPGSDDEEADDGITAREAVMDLAAGGESSSEDEEVDDDDDDDEEEVGNGFQKRRNDDDRDDDEEEEEEEEVSDDSDDNDEEYDRDAGDSAFDWGKRKSAYYQGDTADLEIGQDVEDAFLEEEAAKEVQAARLQEMSEEDFVLSDTEDNPHEDEMTATTTKTSIRTKRDWTKLSKRDQRKFLETRHPELLPLTSYFGDVLKEWSSRTRVAAKALLESDEATAEAVGATTQGKEYLLTKTMLQTSMALNVTMYLLLKSEQASSGDVEDSASLIQAHPVMTRLQQLNSLAQKLEDRVENKIDTLSDQLGNLAKAAALMSGKDVEVDEDDDEEDSSEENAENDLDVDPPDAPDSLIAKGESKKPAGADAADEEDKDDDEDDYDDELARNVLNEARFGLRTNDLEADAAKKRLHRKKRLVQSMDTDLGDDNDDPENYKGATKALSATINSIKQRAETQTRKRQRAPIEDEVEDNEDHLRRGVMEDDDEGLDGAEEGEDELDDEGDGDDLDAEDGFYGQIRKKSKAKKVFKKEKYQVAPKYPRLELEVDGERAINKVILKNRGLVAHKAKINRNPRVKKREQYRKAIIRRKGSVRDVRTDEGHKYGGETTGVKTNLSRSRKLTK